MTRRVGKPAPARVPRFVRQLFPGIGLAMVMVLAHTSTFAQTAIDPTGRSGEPFTLHSTDAARFAFIANRSGGILVTLITPNPHYS